MRLRIIPRERVFFSLFRQHAENLVEGSRLLKEMVERWDDPNIGAKKIVDVEHRGDEITHEIIKKLNTTFVTPLDREDIHALATGLDDILDFIEGAADLFVLHSIERPTPEVIAQAGVLHDACSAVNEAVANLERFKGLEDHWVKISEIEHQGDKMYRRAVADLYNGNHKAMEVLKWKEIYEQIEAAIDGCEDIANQLEAIVLKHA